MQATRTAPKKQSVPSQVNPALRPNPTQSYLRKHSTLSSLNQQGWSKSQIQRRSDKIIAYYTKDRVLQDRESLTLKAKRAMGANQGAGGQAKIPQKTQQIRLRVRQMIEKREAQEAQVVELQRALASEREKLVKLKGKARENNRISRSTAPPDEGMERVMQLQEQYDKSARDYEREMRVFEQEKRQLEDQIEALRDALANTKKHLRPTAQMQLTDPEQERLTDLNERLRDNNSRLEQQIQALSSPKKVDESPPYAEYIEIYSKIFVTSQWERLQAILQAREQQTAQQNQQEREKGKLKDYKKEVESKEKRVKENRKTMNRLTEDIMEKSNSLLQLHSPQRRR